MAVPWCDPPEPDRHVTQTARIVAHIKAGHDATSLVDDTYGMACTTPVQACVKWHVLIPLVAVGSPELGDRADRSLTGALAGKHWRFTLWSVAISRHLPCGWVSVGPSSG